MKFKFVKNVHGIAPRRGGKSMISNQILQNTIEGLKGISRVDLCVMDTEGKELAGTFEAGKDCEGEGVAFVE